jgi:hypothetical protein
LEFEYEVRHCKGGVEGVTAVMFRSTTADLDGRTLKRFQAAMLEEPLRMLRLADHRLVSIVRTKPAVEDLTGWARDAWGYDDEPVGF